MPVTCCNLKSHTDKESKKYWSVGRLVNAFGICSDTTIIFREYSKLNETKSLMNRAFGKWSLMNNFMMDTHWSWKYRTIYDQLTSYKNSDYDYVTKIQNAALAFISQEWVNNNINWITLKQIGKTPKDWKKNWKEWLSPTEQDFVADMVKSLNDVIKSFQTTGFENLWTIIQAIINKKVLWGDFERTQNWRWVWYALWNIVSVGTQQWVGNQNLLWLLWLFSETVVDLVDNNWRVVPGRRVSDLYTDNDDVMFKMWELLFVWNDWDNRPVMSNPKIYRQAVKQFMRKTEDCDWAKINSSLLKYWWFVKMTAPFLNWLAAVIIWIQSAFTWYMNVNSYKKMHSKETLKHVADTLWLNIDYFKMPGGGIRELASRTWNYLTWTAGVRQSQYSDDTYQHSLFDNPSFAWLLSWPMNLLWDIIWRWQYVQIALDKAMTRLWINWVNDLYTINMNWEMELNRSIVDSLIREYTDAMCEVTGMQSVDWWWMLQVGKWSRRPVRIFLQNFMFMKQWATNYVNKLYETRLWWTVWLFSTQKQKDNAYKWPGGNWLIKQYTRSIEKEWYTMPWVHAKEFVTKREYCQEISRLITWLRNAARLVWGRCSEGEDYMPDWNCVLEQVWSIAMLPVQAIESGAHPLLQQLYKFIRDWASYWNFFEDQPWYDWFSKTDLVLNSFIENIVKPFFKSEYLANVTTDVAMRLWTSIDDPNWDSFIEALNKALLSNVNGMISYTSDQLTSYVYWEWAYWPKSLLSNWTMIFGWLNAYDEREMKDWLKQWKNILATQQSAFDRVSSLTPLLRLLQTFSWDVSFKSFYDSDKASKFLLDVADDPEVMSMLMDWEFPEDMKDDPELMQYVWTHLTSDRQMYGAKFKNWIRDNEYNIPEILYTEEVLKYDLENAVKKNPSWSDLEIYDAALRTFFENNPWYDQIKAAIQYFADNGETERWVYTDYLANAHNLMETTGIKGLAIVAEYRKRQLMEQYGIQYSSNQTAAEKKALDIIENKVAEELWPYLWLVDRREYNSIVWAYFTKKHPEYKGYDPFEWLYDKEWKLKLTWDVKTSWVLWTALWMQNLAAQEMAMWSINGYELANSYTEMFGSIYNKEWEVDPRKEEFMAFGMTYLDEFLEDSWLSPIERTYIEAATMIKNQQFLTDVIKWENKYTKWLRDRYEESWILQNMRHLIYDTYNAILDLPELLDKINDEDLVNNLINKNSWYKPKWGYLSGNKTYPQLQKLNDYYKKPVDAFKNRWIKNLTKPINYGKSNYAWSYTPREFYFLNQRCYRNNINSDRIAPDIPLPIWWFSKDTVKAKNPVSGNTTNIKPLTKPTSRIGQSKGIVWWEKSRWPVTSFNA